MENHENKIKGIKEVNQIHLEKMSKQLDLVRNSYRWKIGNAIVRLAEILMLRKTPLLSIDKLEKNLAILQKVNDPSSLLKKKVRGINS